MNKDFKKYFHKNTISKINNLLLSTRTNASENSILRILNKMRNSYCENVDINIVDIDSQKISNELINFNRIFNEIHNSKFENDIKNMEFKFGCLLKINDDSIILNFIMDMDQESQKLASMIIHATNTFCNMFPGNYDGVK